MGRLYRKKLIGHACCDWAVWVWESQDEYVQNTTPAYPQRVFFEEWLCPVCKYLGGGGVEDSNPTRVPEGCLFPIREQALPQFRRMILDLPKIIEREAAMKKEDDAIFHALWMIGCPENCLAVWEEATV